MHQDARFQNAVSFPSHNFISTGAAARCAGRRRKNSRFNGLFAFLKPLKRLVWIGDN
jgi:hypothetical protein